jgi:hypothetical protein
VNLLIQALPDVTSFTKLIDTEPPQLSVAVTASTFTPGIDVAQVTVVAAGQVMLGATLSFTVMI